MKEKVVTFKVSENISQYLNTVPNKSEFIRTAVLQYMNKACPLCRGFGYIEQNDHIQSFLQNHYIEKCGDCSGPIVQCARK